MKNGIWLSVSISLLSAIVHGSELSMEDSISRVITNRDGSVTIQYMDGSQAMLSNEMVQLIKNLKLADKPAFEGGAPCVAINKGN